jgi:hypothetical protein
VGVAASDASSTAAPVKFSQAPAGAKTITVTLSVSEGPGGRHPGYIQRASEQLVEMAEVPASIAADYSGKEFFAFELLAQASGTSYVAVLNEEKTIKFLTRYDSPMWYARLYRINTNSNAKPEILKEGLQTPGNDVSIPVDVELPGIGATKLKKLRTEVGYSLTGSQNGKPQVYGGRGPSLQVVGSEVTTEGKLTLTITVPEELTVTQNTQASLRFEPLTPGLPERSANANIGDFLTLGAARFVVTAVEPDFSQATLAVVAGSLAETLKQQLQLGAEMPPFSQVDLAARKTVTRESLLALAEQSSPIIFVFGDLQSSASRNPYSPPTGMGMSPPLPLPAPDIAEQLRLELEPKPLILFVTRQIGLDFLYGELRNKIPEYFILTDFADPVRTSFVAPQPYPGMSYRPQYPGSREPSLRQLFNLPEGRLSVVAFTPSGKVVYVKADAASDFLQTLAEARDTVKKQLK